MRAKLGNDTVDVWKITDKTPTDAWVKEAFESHKVFWDDEMGGLPMLATFFMKEESVKKINKLVVGKRPRQFLLLDARDSNGAFLGGNLRASIGDYLYKRGELYQFCSEKVFKRDFILI
ncbi:hypothetical protein [Lactovum miscens]|uniref:Uncharacterized protein n=1 Tax=Lactovum miscens TaxID=190387 RepID=A0A841C9B6_9LACT|nr:hypothetical protein [Lactovum miscens]MBB5888182.1 hypothetical protein [Lactovum miscens]